MPMHAFHARNPASHRAKSRLCACATGLLGECKEALWQAQSGTWQRQSGVFENEKRHLAICENLAEKQPTVPCRHNMRHEKKKKGGRADYGHVPPPFFHVFQHVEPHVGMRAFLFSCVCYASGFASSLNSSSVTSLTLRLTEALRAFASFTSMARSTKLSTDSFLLSISLA